MSPTYGQTQEPYRVDVGGLHAVPPLGVKCASHRLRRRPSVALDPEPLAARGGADVGRPGPALAIGHQRVMEVRRGDST